MVRKGRALETDLYCKPTDAHQYLQRASCHPWHTKKAIPYGQTLRIRRFVPMMVSFELGLRNWLVGLLIDVTKKVLLGSRSRESGIWIGKR